MFVSTTLADNQTTEGALEQQADDEDSDHHHSGLHSKKKLQQIEALGAFLWVMELVPDLRMRSLHEKRFCHLMDTVCTFLKRNRFTKSIKLDFIGNVYRTLLMILV